MMIAIFARITIGKVKTCADRSGNKTMITRIWHGRTSPGDAEKYLAFLLGAGTREYTGTPGNLSVKVWRKKDADCCHFWTVTEWADIASVKLFAGDDHEKAKYYPEDDGILLEFEEGVEHYETYVVGAGQREGAEGNGRTGGWDRGK